MAKTLAEQLAEAKARRVAAEATVTEADRADMAVIEEMAREREAEERALEIKRSVDVGRRLLAARERLGADVPCEALTIKGSEHTFIVKSPGATAYRAHMEGLSRAMSAEMGIGKARGTTGDINRAYAVAAVEDWNGIIDFSNESTSGDDLIKFLTEHPAIVPEIVMVADALSKVVKEKRKSGG
jgi:hypothetical protein